MTSMSTLRQELPKACFEINIETGKITINNNIDSQNVSLFQGKKGHFMKLMERNLLLKSKIVNDTDALFLANSSM